VLPDRFVHLRLHSEYSITDGLTRIDEAVAQAAADGMPALAITDLANLFGMVKFYTAARGKGIKPIIGCDVWIGDDDGASADGPARLLLLVKNRAGYLRLCELLSAAYLAPRRHGRAEITRSQLAAGDNSGLIALSGGPWATSGRCWPPASSTRPRCAPRPGRRLFPDSYYIEVQRPGGRDGAAADEVLVAASADLAARLGLPLVATHPVQFLERDDYKAHEARVCIAEGYVLGDKRRPQRFSEEQYFKTRPRWPSCSPTCRRRLQNSVEIARRCNLSVELGKSRLPDFPTPERRDARGLPRQRIARRAGARLAALPDAAGARESAPALRRAARVRDPTIVRWASPATS
jgi:DNA polymerase-3 subunit alpha